MVPMKLARRRRRLEVLGLLLAAGFAVSSCGDARGPAESGPAALLPGLQPCDLPDGPVAVFWGTDEGEGFPRDEPGAPHGADVWSITADGRVEALTDDQRSFDPWLSVDGQRVYFTRGPGGLSGGGPAPPTEAWVRDLATGEERLLFETEPEVKDLRESPDGERLVYAAPEGGEERLHLVDLAAPGEPTVLPTAAGAGGIFQGQNEPTWSPDGSRLAYLAYETDESQQRWDSVHMLDVKTLTDTVIYRPEDPVMLRNLDWTKDGGSLLLSESPGPVFGVEPQDDAIRIDVATGERSVVATGVGYGVTALTADGSLVASVASHAAPGAPPDDPMLKTWDGDETAVSQLPVDLSFATSLAVADCAL